MCSKIGQNISTFSTDHIMHILKHIHFIISLYSLTKFITICLFLLRKCIITWILLYVQVIQYSQFLYIWNESYKTHVCTCLFISDEISHVFYSPTHHPRKLFNRFSWHAHIDFSLKFHMNLFFILRWRKYIY